MVIWTLVYTYIYADAGMYMRTLSNDKNEVKQHNLKNLTHIFGS